VADLVALTGATGFIGGAIAQWLASGGWRVRALARSLAGEARLGPEVQVVRGSLDDLDSLRQLVHGASTVVHCAGAVRGVAPGDFERANADGVARLARAVAEEMPPTRVIAISSLAARHPELSPYAASKRAGEQALRAAAADAVVLRPPAVYGPGDRELGPLWRWMARGLVPVVGPGAGRFSLLFVDDLAAAVARLLQVGKPAAGIFELHDGRPGGYTWADVREEVARWRGAPVHAVTVPALALRAVARANLMLARTRGRAPMLTPWKVRELRHPDWVCDNAALTAATGWMPRVGLFEGLRRSFGDRP
jgi:2-alkyl-3-oxoalkanoate reductase